MSKGKANIRNGEGRTLGKCLRLSSEFMNMLEIFFTFTAFLVLEILKGFGCGFFSFFEKTPHSIAL